MIGRGRREGTCAQTVNAKISLLWPFFRTQKRRHLSHATWVKKQVSTSINICSRKKPSLWQMNKRDLTLMAFCHSHWMQQWPAESCRCWIWIAVCRSTSAELGCAGGYPSGERSGSQDHWPCGHTPRRRTFWCAAPCRRTRTRGRALSCRDSPESSAGWRPCHSGNICTGVLLNNGHKNKHQSNMNQEQRYPVSCLKLDTGNLVSQLPNDILFAVVLLKWMKWTSGYLCAFWCVSSGQKCHWILSRRRCRGNAWCLSGTWCDGWADVAEENSCHKPDTGRYHLQFVPLKNRQETCVRRKRKVIECQKMPNVSMWEQQHFLGWGQHFQGKEWKLQWG